MSTIINGRALGWKPSATKAPGEKPDRAIHGLKLVVTPPESASCDELILGNLDQLQLGGCVPNSGAQAVRASQVKQLMAQGQTREQIMASPPPILSRLFAYWLTRSYWNDIANDDGTQIRTLYEMFNAFGFCDEKLWPYSDRTTGSPSDPFRREPSTEAFEAALAQSQTVAAAGGRNVAYHRIDVPDASRDDIQLGIKRGIASGYPVQFGTQVTKQFCQLGIDPSVPQGVPNSSDYAGGHSMLWTEYNANGVKTLTPWGNVFLQNLFGVFGFFWMSWDYVLNSITSDMWVVDAAPFYAQ